MTYFEAFKITLTIVAVVGGLILYLLALLWLYILQEKTDNTPVPLAFRVIARVLIGLIFFFTITTIIWKVNNIRDFEHSKSVKPAVTQPENP